MFQAWRVVLTMPHMVRSLAAPHPLGNRNTPEPPNTARKSHGFFHGPYSVLVLLGACASPHPLRWASLVPFEQHATVYSPPAVYVRWWDEIVTTCHCQPKTTFGEIAWYTVPVGPDGKFPCGTDRCVGWWWDTDQIFLAQGLTGIEWLVKHEMTHAVLHDGSHRHPLFHRHSAFGGVAEP